MPKDSPPVCGHVDACSGQQGLLFLVANASQEGHGITEASHGLATIGGVSAPGNQETSAREAREHALDRANENAQALARLVEAPQEHDDRAIRSGHPLHKRRRCAERGRLHPVRNDDGVPTVMLDECAPRLLGDGDPHADALHVQPHGRRGNGAGNRAAQRRVERANQRGARGYRRGHRHRRDDGLVDVHDIEVVLGEPAPRALHSSSA